MGLVSLLSDITYESARSISGPYLALLGASAVVVGFVSGLAEFLGYALRLVSGYLVDRLKVYWGFTIVGYALNLFSVPALSLVGSWQWASLLIFIERIGKAIRTPSRDALLSSVTSRIGHGKGFGIHEFLDQVGAFSGSLLVALILLLLDSYRVALALLLFPALFALALLLLAKRTYKEATIPQKGQHAHDTLPKPFIFYLAGVSLYGASFMPFPLIAFHQKALGFQDYTIPLFYAIAMLVDAFSALIFGYLFDKKGPSVLPLGILLSSPYVILVVAGDHYLLFGLFLWGMSLGIQESVMRSWIAKHVPPSSRGRAYGIFHALLGLSALLGSSIMGLLYHVKLTYLVVYSLVFQTFSVVLLFIANSRHSA